MRFENPIRESWRGGAARRAGVVEFAPTAWVAALRDPAAGSTTNLANGRIVDLDELWDNLLQEGLHEPLILRAGRADRCARLDEGNHRIQAFMRHDIAFVPVFCEVDATCIKRPNGAHAFDRDADLLIGKESGVEAVSPPSKVFRSLAALLAAGCLPRLDACLTRLDSLPCAASFPR